MSRRSFLSGVGIAAASVAGGVALSSCSTESASTRDYLPASWDEECELLVVGYGGAGAAAAITASTEELGDVLVIEAAPEGEEGGNTRVCGQLVLSPTDPDGIVEYQTNLNEEYHVDPEIMQAWAEELCKNVDWLTGLGADVKQMPTASPEYPDIEGNESVATWCVDGSFGNQVLWTFLKEVEAECGYRVLYGHRAVRLIFDPATKEVCGVVAETDGGEKNIKATKGVVLSLGGFENDPDMMNAYHPAGRVGTNVIPLGTPYNRGDGIRMCQRIGAGLWHMNSFSKGGLAVPLASDKGEMYDRCGIFPAFKAHDYIFIGRDGKRYMYEETASFSRHGKVMESGRYVDAPIATPTYAIFGSEIFSGDRILNKTPYLTTWILEKADEDGTNQSDLEKGRFMTGDTPEELAAALGVDEAQLKETIESYNANAALGVDPDYGRGTDWYASYEDMTGRSNDKEKTGEDDPSIAAFDLQPLQPPYYACPIDIGILNTQGGPTRSAKGEVTDVDGNPIPRLYAAGEFGCIYGYMYNGGGNVGEALSSGRIAIRNAAALDPWE